MLVVKGYLFVETLSILPIRTELPATTFGYCIRHELLSEMSVSLNSDYRLDLPELIRGRWWNFKECPFLSTAQCHRKPESLLEIAWITCWVNGYGNRRLRPHFLETGFGHETNFETPVQIGEHFISTVLHTNEEVEFQRTIKSSTEKKKNRVRYKIMVGSSQ